MSPIVVESFVRCRRRALSMLAAKHDTMDVGEGEGKEVKGCMRCMQTGVCCPTHSLVILSDIILVIVKIQNIFLHCTL